MFSDGGSIQNKKTRVSDTLNPTGSHGFEKVLKKTIKVLNKKTTCDGATLTKNLAVGLTCKVRARFAPQLRNRVAIDIMIKASRLSETCVVPS